jgi:hypothetical protein
MQVFWPGYDLMILPLETSANKAIMILLFGTGQDDSLFGNHVSLSNAEGI